MDVGEGLLAGVAHLVSIDVKISKRVYEYLFHRKENCPHLTFIKRYNLLNVGAGDDQIVDVDAEDLAVACLCSGRL
ncbi:hypothetical protein U9M48_037385 [Paspalum notatum var. saurae]|uniref:Uncharacterized protein n=1 Tax=Paspalum notatum var. saurae TaxID=547442 RepID=A0AAQ3XB04_PASNO